MGLLGEVRAGLEAAAPFLLSHHPPAEHDRCHSIRLGGRCVHLCARCTGTYPGIAFGVVAAAFLEVSPPVATVAALPAPALAEWVLTGRGHRDGRNDMRTATGVALGLGYGFGVVAVITDRSRAAVLAVGLAYAAVAGALLFLDTR